MSTDHDGKDEENPASKKHRWKLEPDEVTRLSGSAGVFSVFSAVTSLVALYTHDPTVVLAWSAGLIVAAVALFVLINRGFKIKVPLPLPVLIGSLLATALAGAAIGGIIGHQLRNGRGSSSQASSIRYTVYPTEWDPAPVPGLMLTQGEIVNITAIGGQWICATDAGPASIGGNPDYNATNNSWAVPGAPFCSLIGRIGDGPWQEIGQESQFTADRAGPLALTVNELMPGNCPQPPSDTSCYTDNQGAITIKITTG
jgi:hypothetical protein